MRNGSTSNGTGNGNRQGPVDSGECWADGEPVRDPLGELLKALLSEALAKRSNQIQIDICEDRCRVRFVRGSEYLEMDKIPQRFFAPLTDRIARKCGKPGPTGQGDFSTFLKKTETSAKAYGKVKVSVVFGDSHLRLTITDCSQPAP